MAQSLRRRLFHAALWGALAFGRPDIAVACATCSAGDSTLSALGTEAPYAGRLRFGLSSSRRTETTGQAGIDRLQLEEFRAEVSVAWAPMDRLFLLAILPLVDRRVTDVALREQRSRGVGDVELRGRLLLYRDRSFAPEHLSSGVFGVELPTAPTRTDSLGESLPIEAQTGTGALSAIVGWVHTSSLPPWSAYWSAELRLPWLTHPDFQPGAAARSTLALQRAIVAGLSARLALDGRLDRRSTEDGASVSDSGGLILFAGGDVLVDLGADLTVVAGGRAPVIMAKNGHQSEGVTLNLGLAWDL